MLRSMTGYGAGIAPLEGGRLVVEIRTVNHRFLDVRARFPAPLADHAAVVEEVARGQLERGRVDVTGRIEGDVAPPLILNRARAEAAFRELSALRDALSPGEPLPLALLAAVPDLFVAQKEPSGDTLREALRLATHSACTAVTEMRVREGVALRAELESRLARIDGLVASVRERVPDVVAAYRVKLKERLDFLLRETGADPDSGRLEHEVALFADRADVAEEIARLGSHLGQFRELMDDPEGVVGRRLDFLLQEIGREVNTIGSKSPDVPITRGVVEMKAEVERLREQVQNVL